MSRWTCHRERGSLAALRLAGWLVAHLGYGLGYALTWPIAGYFFLSAPRQRRATRRFLRRALGREPGWAELFRSFRVFAATLLDRLFLLRGETAGFELRVEGMELLQARIAAGQGCILMGAHLGSFDALRAIAAPMPERPSGCPVEVVALMHGRQAEGATAFFESLGGAQAVRVIPLGQPEAMLQAKECLERGGLVGILADRGFGSGKVARIPFLGAPAPFPLGPHILAGVLGAPVLIAYGVWTGRRRYTLRFEDFTERVTLDRRDRQAQLEALAAAYAGRIEAVARRFPHNWFNFYDFWEEMPA